MTRDLSWAPKADFVKILLPLVAAAGFSRLRGGPKRLKTDHFEVKNAQSTSNGTFLRVLKKFFGLLKKHKILHRFPKPFQAQDGVSDLRRHETESAKRKKNNNEKMQVACVERWGRKSFRGFVRCWPSLELC